MKKVPEDFGEQLAISEIDNDEQWNEIVAIDKHQRKTFKGKT